MKYIVGYVIILSVLFVLFGERQDAYIKGNQNEMHSL